MKYFSWPQRLLIRVVWQVFLPASLIAVFSGGNLWGWS